MSFTLKKNEKIIAAFLILFVFLIPATPTLAQQYGITAKTPSAIGGAVANGVIGGVLSAAIAKVFYWISYVIAIFGGWLFSFASFLTEFVIELNFDVLNLSSNALVDVGWKITRDIANLGFVLIIVLVALATIIRREEYGAQKLLPKLIGAAIIVNFSLAIAGIFVDFSHVITKFFYDRISVNGGRMSEIIAGAFNPQKFLEVKSASGFDAATQTSSLESLVNGIISLMFTIIFTLSAAFTMFAFGLMLFLRYLYLSFLAVIAPIIWLFWIVPQLSSQFSKWWSNFFKWTFFAPASAFFMYLALRAAQGLSTRTETFKGANGEILPTTAIDLLASGANAAVIIGIMLGGIIIAQKMGLQGSASVMELGKKFRNSVEGRLRGSAVSTRDRALTAGANEKGETTLQRLGTKLGGAPIIGGVFRGASSFSTRAKIRMGKGTEEEINKYKDNSPDNIASRANAMAGGVGPRIESQESLAAIGILAAEKGVWDDVEKNQQKRIKDAMRRTGTQAKLLIHQPQLAGEFEPPQGANEKQHQYDDRIAKAIDRAAGKLEDASKLSPQALQKIATFLRPQHFTQLGNNGSTEQKNKVKEALEGKIGKTAAQGIVDLRKDIDRFTKEIDDAMAQGDKNLAKSLGQQRSMARKMIERAINNLNDDQKKALSKQDAASGNPAWRDVYP